MAQFAVSVPGRTEVAGNHQDHQGGQVIAAAIDRRIECGANSDGGSLITVHSDAGDSFQLDLEEPDFSAPRPEERNTARALVRGMAAQLKAAGVPVQGGTFDFTSDIPLGMGLSSSAAFELCAGAALAAAGGVRISDDCAAGVAGACSPGVARGSSLGPVELARMAMTAERDYFGKPSGLMDQLACALGGIIHIDFADPEEPDVAFLRLPESWGGYASFLVSCESGHEGATSEYAQVAIDMQRVAELLGVRQLRDIAWSDYLSHMPEVREQLGDRAALRGFHFYSEFDLVSRRIRALQADDMRGFVRLTELSGVSSAEYLQNVSAPGDDQPAMLALAFCRMALDEAALDSGGVHDELPAGSEGHALRGRSGEFLAPEHVGAHTGAMRGSARIHGGGFGGTIQVFAPNPHAGYFKERIERLMGPGCCMPVQLGAPGISVSGR